MQAAINIADRGGIRLALPIKVARHSKPAFLSAKDVKDAKKSKELNIFPLRSLRPLRTNVFSGVRPGQARYWCATFGCALPS
jgi:hypothetical protein